MSQILHGTHTKNSVTELKFKFNQDCCIIHLLNLTTLFRKLLTFTCSSPQRAGLGCQSPGPSQWKAHGWSSLPWPSSPPVTPSQGEGLKPSFPAVGGTSPRHSGSRGTSRRTRLEQRLGLSPAPSAFLHSLVGALSPGSCKALGLLMLLEEITWLRAHGTSPPLA